MSTPDDPIPAPQSTKPAKKSATKKPAERKPAAASGKNGAQPAARKPAVRPAAATTSALAPEVSAHLNSEIDALRTGARIWATLTVAQRAVLMERVRAAVVAAAEDWATVAAQTKGLDATHPLRGEEWLSGPYAVLSALGVYERTLKTLAAGHSPLDGVKTSLTPSGQLQADVFPADSVDATLLGGFTGQVWFEPGVTREQARRDAGLAELHPSDSGGVGLVLGAGNITSIPVLDVIYELLAHNRVVLLKVNPTQDRLVPIFTRALLPLIEPGFLRIVTGGGDVGAALTANEAFSHVHITGSATTFDAIVWGTGVEAQTRKQDGAPLLTTPITGELGGVAPIIVVPGEWTQADLDYQAEHVVTMRLQNSGHNCIAGQVVILSEDWAQRGAFLSALRRAYAAAPSRTVWYPNSAPKLAAAAASYPDAQQYGDRLLVTVGGTDDPTALENTEYFAPVLGVVSLPGSGAVFLDAAVAHANDKLAGTLGANVIIDPKTQDDLGDAFERAIEELHYGNIAINGWTGFSFTAPTLSWGAFPGHTLEDVGSGIGIVHNALLLDHVERSVLRGPFRPFPRSIGRGTFTILPKPPWFVTSRTGAQVSEGFTRFRMDGNLLRLTRTMLQALRS